MHPVTVLVPSCDAYSDMWEPLFLNLRKKWPDLPFECFLAVNERGFSFPGVTVVHVGPDQGWSTNLRQALRSIPCEAVLLLIDDLFFKHPVDTSAVQRLCGRFLSEGMDYLRFNPTPGPVGPCDSDGVGRIPRGDPYRASTVVSLWRKDVLLDVLRDGESAWALEVHGSARTDRFENWFACRRWLLPTRNLVVKGRYDPNAWRLLRGEGLPIGTERPLLSGFQYLALLWVRLRAALFRCVPRTWQRRIRERFRAA
jgi:hypothetical protein